MSVLDEQTEFCRNPRCSEYLKHTNAEGYRHCECGNELYKVIGNEPQTTDDVVVCSVCGRKTSVKE